MLVPGEQERTEVEYRRLLAAAGLELTRIIPTQCPISVVEAMPLRAPPDRSSERKLWRRRSVDEK